MFVFVRNHFDQSSVSGKHIYILCGSPNESTQIVNIHFKIIFFFNMSFFKWLKQNVQKMRSKNTRENLNGGSDDDDKRQEEEEITYCYETKLVYFASTTPNQKLIDILNLRYKDVQVNL